MMHSRWVAVGSAKTDCLATGGNLYAAGRLAGYIIGLLEYSLIRRSY
jgi:hypothetical protein